MDNDNEAFPPSSSSSSFTATFPPAHCPLFSSSVARNGFTPSAQQMNELMNLAALANLPAQSPPQLLMAMMVQQQRRERMAREQQKVVAELFANGGGSAGHALFQQWQWLQLLGCWSSSLFPTPPPATLLLNGTDRATAAMAAIQQGQFPMELPAEDDAMLKEEKAGGGGMAAMTQGKGGKETMMKRRWKEEESGQQDAILKERKKARPHHCFSIDGLLKEGGRTNTAGQLARPSTAAAMVDYFMEEHELSWTDGRRSRRRKGVAEPVKTLPMPSLMPIDGWQKGPEAMIEKQPPLPSSSASARSAKHVCTECGKSYATSSNLSRHKQTHRPLDSPHAKKCSFCERVYVSMPALSMHLLTHQARHKCPDCGKLFSRPWLLKGHLRSHTGQKPFGCGNCGKAFSDRSNLRAHLNTHNTDEKRWHCGHCGRAFALKSYLSKHLEQQHDEEGESAGKEKATGRRMGGGGGRRGNNNNNGRNAEGGGISDHFAQQMVVALPSLCDEEEEEGAEEQMMEIDV